MILKIQLDLLIKKKLLMSIIFYNYFENITDKFSMSVNYNNKLILIPFQNGSFNTSDINQIIDGTVQEKFNITEKTNYNINRC